MKSESNLINFYDDNAVRLCQEYEKLDTELLNSWLKPVLPEIPAKILDVGAGSGRDAAWFNRMGYDVTAVEPSIGMRREGEKYHCEENIEWIDDSLPEIEKLSDRFEYYDLILLSAVWMHLSPEIRSNTLKTLNNLLKPKGHIAVSLRIGRTESDKGRHVYNVSAQELHELCKNSELKILSEEGRGDSFGRPEIKWINVILKKFGGE